MQTFPLIKASKGSAKARAEVKSHFPTCEAPASSGGQVAESVDAAPPDPPAQCRRIGRGRRPRATRGHREPARPRSGLVLLAELGDDAEVLERRGVAGALAAGGDVAEEPAHDLAAAGLRQGVGEADVVRAGQGADLLDHVGAELLAELLAGRLARLEGDEGRDRLAAELVGLA